MSLSGRTAAELRADLEAAGDLEALVLWARTVPQQHDAGETLLAEEMPPHIQRMGARNAIVIRNANGSGAHVWVRFGTGFNSYGLLIGADDFAPGSETLNPQNAVRWQPGVWYYEN